MYLQTDLGLCYFICVGSLFYVTWLILNISEPSWGKNTFIPYLPYVSDRQAWANSLDPDEMLQNAVSHLGIHCLPCIQQHWVVNCTGSNFRTYMVRSWGVQIRRVNRYFYINIDLNQPEYQPILQTDYVPLDYGKYPKISHTKFQTNGICKHSWRSSLISVCTIHHSTKYSKKHLHKGVFKKSRCSW